MRTKRLNLTGGIVKIAEIVDDSHIIDGMVATGVTFVGPAIVSFIGANSMDSCRFGHNGGLETLLWEVQPGRHSVTGTIGLTNVTLVGCDFRGIGVAGDSAAINTFVQMMTVEE
jgi:hypothetical protein